MISSNLKKRILTSLVLFLLVFFIFISNLVLAYSLLVLGVLSVLEFLEISKRIIKKKLAFILINIFFVSYVFTFVAIFLFSSNNIIIKYLLFILLLGCIASDLGGYIFGKIFKGPKLTKISPNKTYTGALGSIILTLITISFLFSFLVNLLNFKILIVALITSISCQLGDLFFSFLKRKAKLKDTGNFLPGHGGILDRLDGIFFGIPMGLITLSLLIK